MPAPMRRARDWWNDQSGPDRYRLYTQGALHSVLIALMFFAAVGGIWPYPGVVLVISGMASIAAIESRPELSLGANERQRRLAWIVAVAVLSAVWASSVLVARLTGDPASRAATSAAMFTFLLACVAVVPFLEHRWWLLVLGAAVSSVALPRTHPLLHAAFLIAVGGFLMWTSRMTLWCLRVMAELEASRRIAAELEVAEERLRFSRDLHDVVGRAFAAIAVKSELAATLTRAGATDRAAAEMDEVKALAVSSLEDARKLVRGYRDIDLATEVVGARALLSAAGCQLRVIGEPAAVPPAFHEAAAWVVREGTTNIVKHSAAQQAVLTLQASGLVLRNDGVAPSAGDDGASSGIAGLRDRLRAVGAALDARRTDGDFTVTATWEAP